MSESLYKEGIKSKSYSVTLKSTEHTKQEVFQNGKEFKEKEKSLYKIEAKTKSRQGYDTAAAVGLFGMQIQ